MTTIVNDVSDVGIYNIVAYQGTTFIRQIVYKNSAGTALNLGTGAAASMKVRKSYPATSRVGAYRDAEVLWLGTSEVGATTTALTLTPVSGIIDIKIPSTTMAGVPAGIYDYDLEITLGSAPFSGGVAGSVIKVLTGIFEVKQEMTYVDMLGAADWWVDARGYPGFGVLKEWTLLP